MKDYIKFQNEITSKNLKTIAFKEGPIKAHRERQLRGYKFFSEFMKKDMSLLDVGCRHGNFLDLLKEFGFTNLKGIDCSQEAISIATNKGHDCIVGDIHFLPYPNDSFDGALITHVLEHCPDPKKVLSEVYKAVKSGGYLYIEVPIEPIPTSIPTIPAGHYYTFQSPKSLYSLLRGENFSILKKELDTQKKSFKVVCRLNKG